eukprot:3336372-Pyramimonas_sp.AAC.1
MTYEEGGPQGWADAETVDTCKIICDQCLDMGFPFIALDQAKKVKFMYFRISYREAFTERWTKTCNQGQLKDEPTTPLQDPKDTPKDLKDKPKPKEKKADMVAFAKAKKTMAGAQAALAAARSIESAMADPDNAEWEWASDKTKQKFTNIISALGEKIQSIKLAKLLEASYAYDQVASGLTEAA